MSDQETEQAPQRILHKEYEIPNTDFKPKIMEDFDKMHEQIEYVNDKLQQLFKTKQAELETKYKQEMSRAQTRLRELSESTSESQLKQRMVEKKQTLQREREQFLKDSLYFSNKCKKFKADLDRVCNATNDLQSEITFLNEQIVYADKHNSKLQSELQNLKNEVLKYDQNANFSELDDVMLVPGQKQGHEMATQRVQQQQDVQISREMPSKYISPYSKKNLLRSGVIEGGDLQKAKEELRKQKEIYEKLNEFLNDPCFQETEFERIFMESVMTVKSKKQQSNKDNKLPSIKNNNTKVDQSQNEESSIKRQNESTLDFTTLSDFDFNEFGKRQILEDFLSRDEIKRYLYSLIFNPPQNKQAKNESYDEK